MGPNLVKDNPESVMIKVCSGEAWGRGARKGSGFQQHLSLQGSVEGSQKTEEGKEGERQGERQIWGGGERKNFPDLRDWINGPRWHLVRIQETPDS